MPSICVMRVSNKVDSFPFAAAGCSRCRITLLRRRRCHLNAREQAVGLGAVSQSFRLFSPPCRGSWHRSASIFPSYPIRENRIAAMMAYPILAVAHLYRIFHGGAQALAPVEAVPGPVDKRWRLADERSSGRLAVAGLFPLLHLTLFDMFPTGDHGLDVGADGVAGGGHVDVDDDKAQDGEGAGRMDQCDGVQRKPASPHAFHEL